jgi:formate dehydrogenase alpha subunit
MSHAPRSNALEIDGREVPLAAGDTLLSAARRAGIEIPALCEVPGLPPDGGCRLCLVEVEGAAHPLAACCTPASAGARVRTATPAREAQRREILALIAGSLGRRPEPGPLLALFERYGVDPPPPAPARYEDSHPYLRFDPALCITCRRCVHACAEIPGRFVFTVTGRGPSTQLAIGTNGRFADSECVGCGACVEVCPTGALSDCDRLAGEVSERHAESVCGYCGVGCRTRVATRGDRVLRIEGVASAQVNRGQLCAKGRYAHAWQSHPERLREPLLREGPPEDPRWKPISWEAAISLAASRLRRIRDGSGPGALGAFASSRSTNEAVYLLQKLFRAELGTNHVDCCARVCHASTAEALRDATGTGAASACYSDIEAARFIVVAGANPTEAHPVLGARILQAARRGVPLVVIDPRRIELCAYAEQHLAPLPGTNVALFSALAKRLIERGGCDDEYVGARCEGFAELRAQLGALSLDAAARHCGVDVAAIERTARRLAESKPILFVHGLGLSELYQGVDSVLALANLALLTGSIGRVGAGVLPLRGQNNVQGAADMGAMPNLVTGYQPLSDPALRVRLERIWGQAPPESPGLTIPEMLEAAAVGEVRALWIQGEDVLQSDPHETLTQRALAKLDFLVVQELFVSETARYAHLLLPAAGCLEQDGTFTNAERRIQRVRRAVPPPGLALPDWEVVRDVARALGADWRYASAADVMDEIARVAPKLFGGVRFDRLDGDGLQWPCPAPEHPGTARVHVDRFMRGRARLTSVAFEPSAEHGVSGYPYLLVTGRVLQHYNVGTMTRRTPQRGLAVRDWLEIHPDDATRGRFRDGEEVLLESRWGSARVPLRVSTRVAPGTLFLTFHFPETHANRVVGPVRDPHSNCPQYKATAVRLQKLAALGSPREQP